MAHGSPQLLIAYDGSPSAATAVRAAASLFRDASVSVATVPSEPTVHAGTAVPVLPGLSPDVAAQMIDELRAEAQRQAGETAEHAVEQARTLGLAAEPVTVPPSAPAWAALLDAAHRLDADPARLRNPRTGRVRARVARLDVFEPAPSHGRAAAGRTGRRRGARWARGRGI
jgi:acetylornithine deacetylase/succinyl-diaminopimelate desuccinylase-like protein